MWGSEDRARKGPKGYDLHLMITGARPRNSVSLASQSSESTARQTSKERVRWKGVGKVGRHLWILTISRAPSESCEAAAEDLKPPSLFPCCVLHERHRSVEMEELVFPVMMFAPQDGSGRRANCTQQSSHTLHFRRLPRKGPDFTRELPA